MFNTWSMMSLSQEAVVFLPSLSIIFLPILKKRWWYHFIYQLGKGWKRMLGMISYKIPGPFSLTADHDPLPGNSARAHAEVAVVGGEVGN